MAEVAGAPDGVERGASAEAPTTRQPRSCVDYHSNDIVNILPRPARYRPGAKLKFGAVLGQSTGDELLTGTDFLFDWGVKAELGGRPAHDGMEPHR
jgi:hypothetical protein